MYETAIIDYKYVLHVYTNVYYYQAKLLDLLLLAII